MYSAVRRERQVLNSVNFISCRTQSGMLKAYGSLKEPLHATRLFLPIAMSCTFFFFFYADLNIIEWGALSIASV